MLDIYIYISGLCFLVIMENKHPTLRNGKNKNKFLFLYWNIMIFSPIFKVLAALKI